MFENSRRPSCVCGRLWFLLLSSFHADKESAGIESAMHNSFCVPVSQQGAVFLDIRAPVFVWSRPMGLHFDGGSFEVAVIAEQVKSLRRAIVAAQQH